MSKTLKVDQEAKDIYGNWCLTFNSTNLKDITNWLWQEYGDQGYKFAIVINVSGEYSEPEKTTCVYFLDGIEEEVQCYCGHESIVCKNKNCKERIWR